MSDELPARPRVTIAYRMTAYEESELLAAKEFLSETATVELEPMSLTLMGGLAEIIITIEFAEPLFAGGTLSRHVSSALGEVCISLSEWHARLLRNRPCTPEVLSVRLAGRDVRIDLSSDLAPEAFLGCREVRLIPRLMRDIASRASAVLERIPARYISLGFHADPQAVGAHACVIGRFWETGQDDDEPSMLIDSWRDRTYMRSS